MVGVIFDRDLFTLINKCDHIQKVEDQLEEMKDIYKEQNQKKKLAKERNILTAQLSRDRKKIEVELLRNRCCDMTVKMNKARNILMKQNP